jgi:hypothetical protein
MQHLITVWVYTKKGSVDSISKEKTAVVLAEMFPDRIYFFAELVPPFEPNKK